MKIKTFLIDGRFLESMSTGIDRYAAETIKELDKICAGKDIRILAPNTAKNVKSPGGKMLSQLKNIRVIYARRGRYWTQITFALYARAIAAVPINMCNEVSTLAPRGIVCLHDVCYMDCPDMFSEEEVEWFLALYKRIAKKAKVIITVSEFSKERILKMLGNRRNDIKVVVAGNGWQHFDRIEPNEYIFDKLRNIERGTYYFTLSSANKNKNLDWIIQASQYNLKDEFVIGGRNLDRVIEFEKYPNVYYAGAVTDEESKALMKHCKAFIFPSFYEGFGIPPLEAMSAGAPVIISDRASLPEVFGGSAHYVDPNNPAVNFDRILSESTEPAENVLDKYSWSKTAKRVLSVISEFGG